MPNESCSVEHETRAGSVPPSPSPPPFRNEPWYPIYCPCRAGVKKTDGARPLGCDIGKWTSLADSLLVAARFMDECAKTRHVTLARPIHRVQSPFTT